MRRVALLCLLLCFICGPSLLYATETEHIGMKLRPAPGRVVVDGKLDDWDLTGGIFAVNDVENLRDEYGAWFHAMYDEKNVYLLARWNDPTPLNNPGSSKGDMGFQGDCLQVRFITACETPQERVTHWTCWRDRDGLDLMDMACGREFNEGGLRDAKMKGARQMFAVYDDRKGYMQEMSIPWSLLTKDGAPLKPGDQPRMTLEPNYTAGAFGRVTIKDIFKEGIVPDRVFTFRAYGHWGTATLEKAGNQQPRPIRLSDGREFPVSMEKGLPVVNWAGLIKTEEMPGFMPIRFTMPADGYVSLNILDKDGVVVRQLLTCAFYTKGEHEVKWDGLATPYWRKPGSPVEPGEYSWKAIMHTGIGLRLRGWASNGGNAPWDSSLTSNWGGDHGVPIACTTDGEKVYLGWSGAEAGKALVACDLEANVAWKHTHGGMGGAQLVAVDGGIVYVASGPSLIYRVDTVRGTYSAWKGKETATIQVNAIWADPAGMPVRIEGMDAKNGKLYVTCSAATLNRGDVKDWRSLLQRIYTGDGLARSIHAKLREHSRNRLAWWFDANPDATEEDACKSPNYYTPDVRDDAVNVLNGLLDDTGLVPGGATLSADRLAQANRTLIEKTFAGLFAPMKTNFLAVLDGQTGKARKLIDVEVPRSVRAVSDTLVYVVSDRSSVLAVDPNAGAVRAVVTGLQNAAGVAVDDNGRIYVSVQDPDHQVKIFSPDGRPAGEIGRKGGRPEMGPWVRNAMRKPVGVVVDKAGKLWVMETTSNPKRISVWDAKSGKFLKELFGPTHYGASGGAINPRDPNIMAGEGAEWRIDPKTGRATCLGSYDRDRWGAHAAAIYAEGSNGKLYLAALDGPILIWERLGDGQFALRSAIRPLNERKITEFWADENGDAREQPNEVAIYPGVLQMKGYLFVFNVNGDLTLYATDGGRRTGLQIKVGGFTPCGAPKYNIAGAGKLPPLAGALSTPNNSRVLSVFDDWFRCYDVATGKQLWTYPNTFSGVHGSHKAPPPKTGLIRGAFGIVGNAALPEPLGAIWAINSNVGEWHILTEDGFYLSRIFQGDGFKVQWPDQAVPGAALDNCPPGLGGEDFGGSMRQGNDGKVYIQAGKTALWNIALVGLDSVRAVPGGSINVGAQDVTTAQGFRERQLQTSEGTKQYTAGKSTPAFTGNLDADFQGADVLTFEKQAGSRIRAVAAWDDANLYIGWEVADDAPWLNGADAPEFMYARGDTVDFQLGTDLKADKNRADPVKGDLRLSIGNFKGRPAAVVYRKVADEKHPKTFSSGVVKEYTMDSVIVLGDTRIEVKVDAPGKRYVVEAAIPQAALGVKITDGLVVRGDFGATHGDKAGTDTLLRTHWNNQQTGLVNDEVFELRMEPKNFGTLVFKQ